MGQRQGSSHVATPDIRESHKKEASKPSAVQGASLLILMQLTSRLVTFVANQILLRFLTASLLGISAQLEVFYVSVLFFARESLRVSIQRQDIQIDGSEDEPATDKQCVASQSSQAIINLGYLAIVLGLGITVGLAWIYVAFADELLLQTPYLRPSLYIYGVAAMIELLSEPCFVLLQKELQFGTRAAAESLATFSRCLMILASAVLAWKRQLPLGVLPFALGQLTFGVVLSLVYIVSGHGTATSAGFSLLPQPIQFGEVFLGGYLYKPTLRLARSMMVQSVVKHVLTQGDSFLVSFLTTPEVQGTYALAANYGGLLARLLFQPVEESSRSYFSKLLATRSGPVALTSRAAAGVCSEIEEAKTNFQVLARLYLLLSAIVISIGPFAASPLLAIVAGPRWNAVGADEVLSVYCFYIPFLAMNGLAESFVASVATERELHQQSIWMGFFSIIFATAAFVFMRLLSLGAQGLVIANIVNMLCRIIWSLAFIQRYLKRNNSYISATSILPGNAIVLSFSVAWALRNFAAVDTGATAHFKSLAKLSAFAFTMICLMYVTNLFYFYSTSPLFSFPPKSLRNAIIPTE